MSQAAVSSIPSENQRARAAKGVQLSPLKPYQPLPHTYPTGDADVAAKGGAPDQGVSQHQHLGGEDWVNKEQAEQEHEQQEIQEQQEHMGVQHKGGYHTEHTVFQQHSSGEQREDQLQPWEKGGGGDRPQQGTNEEGGMEVSAESQQAVAGRSMAQEAGIAGREG